MTDVVNQQDRRGLLGLFDQHLPDFHRGGRVNNDPQPFPGQAAPFDKDLAQVLYRSAPPGRPCHSRQP
jgi:hypothetical protein